LVVVITGLARRRRLFRSQAFNKVVTSQRAVFDSIADAMLSATIPRARDSARAQGDGLFGQWRSQASGFECSAQQYIHSPTEELLRKHTDSCAIALQQILQASFRPGEPERGQPDQVIIRGPAKLKFDLRGTAIDEAEQSLRRGLAERVRAAPP
jgi:hypothetical protein